MTWCQELEQVLWKWRLDTTAPGKENIKSYGIFHTGGGGVDPISITFSGKKRVFFKEKKCFFHKKYKDDQNGLIHPEM